MSEEDVCDGFQEPNMRIHIKSLMGTVFDVNVTPVETIADIKKKIHRIEGIPTFHQNLIFRSQDLKDSNRLIDAGITNGSTLTLVTSMRGGPISTRRLSITCDHHVMLKELKELLENTKEEITPGSKVSVLVFKEGEVINLLRVIENDDGSYSPYNEKPISPPSKPTRRGPRIGIFERFVEDNDMSTKIANLRKKMEEVSSRKQINTHSRSVPLEVPKSESTEHSSSSKHDSLSFKFLTRYTNSMMDNLDLKVYEKNTEEDNEEEIALKDKHRSKPHKLCDSKTKSLFSESRGAYSCIKENYARINKKSKQSHSDTVTALSSSTTDDSKDPTEKIAVFGENDCSGSVPMTNRFHLTRLILSESNERPKSSADSIELEENVQDLWEIHEPASERLKHSTTCKVGLLKRRQSLDYGYESIKNSSKSELTNYSCENSNFEVCSGNLYRIPQFASPPSAGPSHHAPREHSLRDYYFTKSDRSPLYCRNKSEDSSGARLKPDELDAFTMLNEYSSIQRLQNDSSKGDAFSPPDDLHGYYNLACSNDSFVDKVDMRRKTEHRTELPPVMKKKARCHKCNRKLNVTNIHSCRCGRIFCSQHRYSEVHQCGYDYKSEGRRLLQQQNPLVAAEKINKI